MPHADIKLAGAFLLDRVAAGLLNIYVERIVQKPPLKLPAEAPVKILPSVYFEQLMGPKNEKTFWQVGGASIRFKIGGTPTDTTLVGLHFDERDILKLAAEHALPSPSSIGPLQLNSRPRDTGGRSSSKHGAPIAVMALRYAQLSLPVLNRTKAISLQQDLIDLYKEFGVEPPKGKNLEGICGGILHALRDPEMRRSWQP